MKQIILTLTLILIALGAFVKTPAPSVSPSRTHAANGWHDVGIYAGEIGDVDTKKSKS